MKAAQQQYLSQAWLRVRKSDDRLEDKGFAAHLRELTRPVQIAYQRLMMAYNGEPIGIECKHEDRESWAFVVPEMSSSEPWRVQYFDADGFVGHSCHGSLEAAVESIIEERYRVIDAGALDRIGATARWRRGVKVAAVRQRMQEGRISYAQFIDEVKALPVEPAEDLQAA